MSLCVDAPADLARLRNEARAGAARVPAHVFDRLCAAFEAPDEGPCSLRVDSTALPSVERLWCELLAAWGPAPPVPPLAAELEAARLAGQAATAASKVHAWDLRARQEVAAAVARGACLQTTQDDCSSRSPAALPSQRAHVAARFNNVRARGLASLRAAADPGLVDAAGEAMLAAFEAARVEQPWDAS